MQVDVYPASEFDSHTEGLVATSLKIEPKFYAPKGQSVLLTAVVTGDSGKTLDRVVISVNGHGALSMQHRKEPVVAAVDVDVKGGGSGSNAS